MILLLIVKTKNRQSLKIAIEVRILKSRSDRKLKSNETKRWQTQKKGQ